MSALRPVRVWDLPTCLCHWLATPLRHLQDEVRAEKCLEGDKLLPEGTPASAEGAGAHVLATPLLAACAGGVAWLVSLGG